MRKGLLIYNPRSGQRLIGQQLDSLLEYALSQDLYLLPVRLEFGGSSDEVLREMLMLPWVELVVVSGGDGTLSAIAQEILNLRPEMPMGIIPSGTCNDFAESLRLPQDERDCIDVVAEGNSMALDVGRVNGEKLFLSTCAAGMFVSVSFKTNSELKKGLGPLAYYFQALGELTKIRSFPMRIETESEVFEDEVFLFLILNGKQAAGFPNMYAKARMHDGLMDMIIIRKCPPLETGMLLFELLNRDHLDGKWIKHIQAQRFHISSSEKVVTTLDGEKGMDLPFNIEVLPQALSVFVTHR